MQENFAAPSVVHGQLSVAKKQKTEDTRQYALANKHYVKLVVNLLG